MRFVVRSCQNAKQELQGFGVRLYRFKAVRLIIESGMNEDSGVQNLLDDFECLVSRLAGYAVQRFNDYALAGLHPAGFNSGKKSGKVACLCVLTLESADAGVGKSK